MISVAILEIYAPEVEEIYLTADVRRRHTAIKEDGRVLLHLKDGPQEPEVVSVPKHKKHPPAGTKATTRTRVGPQPPCALKSVSVRALHRGVIVRACTGVLHMNPHNMSPCGAHPDARKLCNCLPLEGESCGAWGCLAVAGRMGRELMAASAGAGGVAGAGGCAPYQRGGGGYSDGLGQCHC